MASEDVIAFLRLLASLAVLAALLIVSLMLYGRLPLLGSLPLDISIPLPTGSLFLPLGSSACIAILLTAVGWITARQIRRQKL